MAEIVRDEAVDAKIRDLCGRIRIDPLVTEQLMQKYGSERAWDLVNLINSNPRYMAESLNEEFFSSRQLATLVIARNFPSEKIDAAIEYSKQKAQEDLNSPQAQRTIWDYYHPENQNIPHFYKECMRSRVEEKVDEKMENYVTYPSNMQGAVTRARKEDYMSSFPPLDRNDFASDDEYKKALQNQYVAMKNKQWEYATLEAAMSGHNLARCLSDDERQRISYTVENAEKMIDKYGLVQRTGMSKEELLNSTFFNTGVQGSDGKSYPDCAMSSAKNAAEGCENMGSYGNKNVVGTGRLFGAGLGNGIHNTIQEQYNFDPRYGNSGRGDKAYEKDMTLDQLIKAGKIGPGDIISYGRPLKQNETGTGHHAMTVSEIKRDENDNVVSYTILDHNGGGENTWGTRIRTFKCPNTDEGNKPVLYTSIHKIKEDEFIAEAQGASIEELEKMVNTTRQEVVGQNGLIDQLASEEHKFMFDDQWQNHCKPATRVPNIARLQTQYVDYFMAQNEAMVRDNLYAKYERQLYEDLLTMDLEMEAHRPEISGAREVTPDAIAVPTENMSEADRYAYERKHLEMFMKRENNESFTKEQIELGKARIEELGYLEERARLRESLREMSAEFQQSVNLEEIVLRTPQSVKEEMERLERYKSENKENMSKYEAKILDEYIKSLRKEEKFRRRLGEKGLDDDLRQSFRNDFSDMQSVDVRAVAQSYSSGVSFERSQSTNTPQQPLVQIPLGRER